MAIVLLDTTTSVLGLVLVPATLGLVVTVPWGVVALVVRTLRTPVPGPRARVDAALLGD